MAQRTTSAITYVSVSSSQRKHIAEDQAMLQGMGVATAVPYLRSTALGYTPAQSDTKHFAYLVDLVKSGIPTLIDSGAYEVYSRGHEVDWHHVFAEYESIARYSGDHNNLLLIAPDEVGNPWGTLELQSGEQDKMDHLRNVYGVKWIYPLQGTDPAIWSKIYRALFNGQKTVDSKWSKEGFYAVALPMAAMRDDTQALDKITDFLARKAKWDLYFAPDLGHYPKVHYLGLGDMAKIKQIAIRQIVITGMIQKSGFRECWYEGLIDQTAELMLHIISNDPLMSEEEEQAIRELSRMPEWWWEDQLMLLYGLDNQEARSHFGRQLKGLSLSVDHSTLSRAVSNYRWMDDTGKMAKLDQQIVGREAVDQWNSATVDLRLLALLTRYAQLDRENVTAADMLPAERLQEEEMEQRKISLF